MISVRRAHAEDAESISRLICHIAREQIGPTLSPDGLEVLLKSIQEAPTRLRLTNDWPTFCALQNGVLAGVVMVKPSHHLYHLFVSQDFQRKGLGSTLLETADADTHASTGTILKTVNASLNAIEFYQRFGFDIKGKVIDDKGVRYQPMQRPQNLSTGRPNPARR